MVIARRNDVAISLGIVVLFKTAKEHRGSQRRRGVARRFCRYKVWFCQMNYILLKFLLRIDNITLKVYTWIYLISC